MTRNNNVQDIPSHFHDRDMLQSLFLGNIRAVGFRMTIGSPAGFADETLVKGSYHLCEPGPDLSKSRLSEDGRLTRTN